MTFHPTSSLARGQELFAEAQRVVRWHYQWRNDPFIPVEFSVAGHRFGHSQVRPSYRANFATSADDPLQQFFALFLDPAAADPDDPADLRGGRRAPRRFIDWRTFFDFGDGRVRPNKRIDTKLCSCPSWPRPTSRTWSRCTWSGARRCGSTCCARPR